MDLLKLLLILKQETRIRRLKWVLPILQPVKLSGLKPIIIVDQYIAWPFWTPDSKKLAVQVINRDQNDLQIILADASTGDFTKIYNETRKTWVEFHEDIYVMKNGSGFIVRS